MEKGRGGGERGGRKPFFFKQNEKKTNVKINISRNVITFAFYSAY